MKSPSLKRRRFCCAPLGCAGCPNAKGKEWREIAERTFNAWNALLSAFVDHRIDKGFLLHSRRRLFTLFAAAKKTARISYGPLMFNTLRFLVCAGVFLTGWPLLQASPTLDIVSTQAGVGGITLTFSKPFGSATTASYSGVIAGEMKGLYNPGGGSAVTSSTLTLYTFCVDMLHDIGLPSGFYGVNTPSSVAGLGTNGGRIAWLYDNFGSIGGSPLNNSANYTVAGHTYIGSTFAAALQLTMWYLTDPLPVNSFTFSVSNSTLNTSLHDAFNDFLSVSNGKSDVGLYLSSNSSGQGFLYPPFGPLNPNVVTPEPSSLSIGCAAIALAFAWVRARRLVAA